MCWNMPCSAHVGISIRRVTGRLPHFATYTLAAVTKRAAARHYWAARLKIYQPKPQQTVLDTRSELFGHLPDATACSHRESVSKLFAACIHLRLVLHGLKGELLMGPLDHCATDSLGQCKASTSTLPDLFSGWKLVKRLLFKVAERNRERERDCWNRFHRDMHCMWILDRCLQRPDVVSLKVRISQIKKRLEVHARSEAQ